MKLPAKFDDQRVPTAIGRHTVRLDLWIPILYAVVSCAWIFLSGRLVAALAGSSKQHATWEMLKGFGFVAVTAALLYAGLRWALIRERSAHLQVAASEARFRAILRSIADAVITTDERARVALLNPAAEALTGWKAEEAIGRPLAEVFHVVDAETRQRAPSPLERVLHKGGVVGLNEAPVLIARDGSERAIADSASPILGSDGRISGVVLVFRDQHEERRAQQALRESDERLRLALDAAGMGSWYWDLANDCSVWTGRCKELFGLAPDTVMTYDRFLGAIHPEDRERIDRAMKDALAGGTDCEVEMRVPLPDGGIGWVASKGRAFRHGGGSSVRIAGVARDITDRKRAEEVLREQLALRDQFSKVASSFPGAIVSFRLRPDGTGSVTFTTPAAEELFGIPGHVLVEDIAAWAANVHPDDARFVNDAVAEAARTVSRWHIEYRYLHPIKGLRWIEGWADPTAEPDGSILWHGLVTDITERKTIEEERKRADEALLRLGAAVEQAPASIVITDEIGAIQYVNPAFERTTGYSAAEIFGQTPRVLKSGTHDPDFYRRLWETVSSGRVWSGRVVNRTKSGVLFTEDAVIAPVKDHAGVVRNYVAVTRDVTEELKLQNQLFEAQKLESVARLAGGIAHDFNNLLTVILSCTEALRQDLASGRPANMEDVDEVHSAGERARELTRQLLAFARRQVIEPVSFDLSGLVQKSEKLLRRVLNEDIVLDVVLQPELWPVCCDPGQAEQVLLNLVVNAGDAMVHGGKLRIETSNQEVTHAHGSLYPGISPGPHVRFAVHDSGMGMPPEVKARLFEPFFTTKPIGKGTGLGLATVHGIVKQSGGFIRVESEPGYGTTVEVLFPRAGAPASPSPAAVPLAATRGRETVLLVEDDPQVRTVTARALGAGGYTVLVAGNGLDALEILSSHRGPLDLLVTDVIMPGVDGRQLAEAIRRSWPELRVLYVSGHAHDVLGQRGALDPGIDLLPKPYTPVSLLARVRAALARS